MGCLQGPDSSLTSLRLNQQSQGQSCVCRIPAEPTPRWVPRRSAVHLKCSTGVVAILPCFSVFATDTRELEFMQRKHSVGPYFLRKCFSQEAKSHFFIQPRLVKFVFAKWVPISQWFFAPPRQISYGVSRFHRRHKFPSRNCFCEIPQPYAHSSVTHLTGKQHMYYKS